MGMNEMWRIFTSKGGENRIRIINALLERPYNTNEVAEILNINYRTAQHHLVVLRKANYIDEGRNAYGTMYSIAEYFKRNKELFDRIKNENGNTEKDTVKQRLNQTAHGSQLKFKYFKYRRRKTKSYYVMSKHDQSYLGTIQWERTWRQYVFYPNQQCRWSWKCLKELSGYIRKLTEDWNASLPHKDRKTKTIVGSKRGSNICYIT